MTHLSRLVSSAVTACLALVLWPGLGRANGGPYIVTSPGASQLGQLVPIKSKQIALVEEDVHLDVLMHYTVGRVRYKLHNLGPETTVTFGFPTLVFEGLYLGKRTGDYLRYEIRVDGKTIAATKKLGKRLTRAEVRHLVFPNLKDRGGPDLSRQFPGQRHYRGLVNLKQTRRMLRLSTIRFARQQQRRLDITFVVPNYVQVTLGKYRSFNCSSYVSYLTRPARRWKGRIRKATFRIRVLGRPKARNKKRRPLIVYPKPHRTTKAGFHWSYKNWLPKENFRMVVPFTTDNRFKDLWSATSAGLDKLYGPRIPVSALKRTELSKKRGGHIALKRKRPLAPGAGWFLTNQMLPRPLGRKRGTGLTFHLNRPHCVRGVAMLQPNYFSQPMRMELWTEGRFHQSLSWRKDGYSSAGGSWAGVQVVLLRRPVRAKKLTLRILSGHVRYSPLKIRRLGFIQAPAGSCRARHKKQPRPRPHAGAAPQ